MSATYTVEMDCPHATPAEVLWQVWLADETDAGVRDPADARGHLLWVPDLESWTLDTLRMVLHELKAYLPAHDEAFVRITAKVRPWHGNGRTPAVARPPKFDGGSVRLAVIARGWRAEVNASRNEDTDDAGKTIGWAGDWSEPMQAVLLDLAAQSPFPLAGVALVAPSLDCVSRGALPRGQSKRSERDGPTMTVRAIVKDLERLARNDGAIYELEALADVTRRVRKEMEER